MICKKLGATAVINKGDASCRVFLLCCL